MFASIAASGGGSKAKSKLFPEWHKHGLPIPSDVPESLATVKMFCHLSVRDFWAKTSRFFCNTVSENFDDVIEWTESFAPIDSTYRVSRHQVVDNGMHFDFFLLHSAAGNRHLEAVLTNWYEEPPTKSWHTSIELLPEFKDVITPPEGSDPEVVDSIDMENRLVSAFFSATPSLTRYALARYKGRIKTGSYFESIHEDYLPRRGVLVRSFVCQAGPGISTGEHLSWENFKPNHVHHYKQWQIYTLTHDFSQSSNTKMYQGAAHIKALHRDWVSAQSLFGTAEEHTDFRETNGGSSISPQQEQLLLVYQLGEPTRDRYYALRDEFWKLEKSSIETDQRLLTGNPKLIVTDYDTNGKGIKYKDLCFERVRKLLIDRKIPYQNRTKK